MQFTGSAKQSIRKGVLPVNFNTTVSFANTTVRAMPKPIRRGGKTMTCKQCVSYDVCGKAHRRHFADENGAEYICKHFKNKADYTRVVRCKDCKHCDDQLASGLWCNHPDNRNPLGCRPIDFCNDGERKDRVNNG